MPRAVKRLPPVTRAELALALLVIAVIAFLFWSRNVIVRWPGVATPIG